MNYFRAWDSVPDLPVIADDITRIFQSHRETLSPDRLKEIAMLVENFVRSTPQGFEFRTEQGGAVLLTFPGTGSACSGARVYTRGGANVDDCIALGRRFLELLEEKELNLAPWPEDKVFRRIAR